MTEHKYLLTLRPFGIGTFPDKGYIRFEESELSRYGVVVMDHQLPASEYRRFDLLPLTEMEEVAKQTWKDDYFDTVSISWWRNMRGADVTLVCEEEDFNEVHDMRVKDILDNIYDGYWKPKV